MTSDHSQIAAYLQIHFNAMPTIKSYFYFPMTQINLYNCEDTFKSVNHVLTRPKRMLEKTKPQILFFVSKIQISVTFATRRLEASVFLKQNKSFYKCNSNVTLGNEHVRGKIIEESAEDKVDRGH